MTRRRFPSILLMLALLWQALAGLTPVGQQLGKQEVVNAVLHGQQQEHHHHSDRSLHADSGTISDADGLLHHHVSDGVQTAGLLPPATCNLEGLPRAVPTPWWNAGFCSITLDGLLRPPQHFSV